MYYDVYRYILLHIIYNILYFACIMMYIVNTKLFLIREMYQLWTILEIFLEEYKNIEAKGIVRVFKITH